MGTINHNYLVKAIRKSKFYKIWVIVRLLNFLGFLLLIKPKQVVWMCKFALQKSSSIKLRLVWRRQELF